MQLQSVTLTWLNAPGLQRPCQVLFCLAADGDSYGTLQYGLAALQGPRESMEDYATVVPRGRCGFLYAGKLASEAAGSWEALWVDVACTAHKAGQLNCDAAGQWSTCNDTDCSQASSAAVGLCGVMGYCASRSAGITGSLAVSMQGHHPMWAVEVMFRRHIAAVLPRAAASCVTATRCCWSAAEHLAHKGPKAGGQDAHAATQCAHKLQCCCAQHPLAVGARGGASHVQGWAVLLVSGGDVS